MGLVIACHEAAFVGRSNKQLKVRLSTSFLDAPLSIWLDGTAALTDPEHTPTFASVQEIPPRPVGNSVGTILCSKCGTERRSRGGIKDVGCGYRRGAFRSSKNALANVTLRQFMRQSRVGRPFGLPCEILSRPWSR